MVNIKIKRLKEEAILPTKSTKQAAGFDLYASLDNDIVKIFPHTNVKIGTGISLEIPNGYVALIFARSGIATNDGLRPANCVGVIDSDYRGEYIVPLFNDTNDIKIIKNKDRIAQLIILPYPEISFTETTLLTSTLRGNSGFGSSGK